MVRSSELAANLQRSERIFGAGGKGQSEVNFAMAVARELARGVDSVVQKYALSVT